MIDDLATVYRYDQRACGRSSGSPRYTLDEAVAAARERRTFDLIDQARRLLKQRLAERSANP